MQKFTAEVELTSTLSSRMSEKKFLRPQTMLFTVKKSEENWGKTSYVNILGWLMAQDWLQFFCLILMKKGQITNNNCLLSLVSLLIHKSIQKTQQKYFGARFVKLLFVYIFSVFSSHLPKYLPAHKMKRAPSANACKKQLTFIVSFFRLKKIASRKKS